MIGNKNISIELRRVRQAVVSIVLLACGGCALFPPQPPGCQGQFKPVNAEMQARDGASVKDAQGAANGQ